MQNLFLQGIREKSVASFWEINSQQPTDCLFTSRHLTDSSLLFFIALTNVNFQLFSSFKSWRLVQYLGNCLKWRCSILYFRRLWSRQAQLFCPTIYATSWLIFLSRVWLLRCYKMNCRLHEKIEAILRWLQRYVQSRISWWNTCVRQWWRSEPSWNTGISTVVEQIQFGSRILIPLRSKRWYQITRMTQTRFRLGLRAGATGQ